MTAGNRTTSLILRVTEEEKKLIQERVKQAGIKNLSTYTRQMLINGQVIKKDYRELKDLTAQIGKIGSNINQIAKRANESRTVSGEDIYLVMKMLEQIHRLLGTELKKVLK